jgi:hypothetical protein
MSKSTKFDPQNPSGRIAFDERGNARWEWRTDTGSFKADIDTCKVRALQESTDTKLGGTPGSAPAQPAKPGGDPYRTADAPRAAEKKPRRTLDDMRRLSEEIKRARAQKKSP